MNKVKKALIATSLAGALVASAGYGTYSWFTAEAQTAGTITNGTLKLSEFDSRLFDQAKFAPSQLLMGNWTSFKNTGNLDQILKLSYHETLNMGTGSLGQYTYQGFVLTVPENYVLSQSEKAFYEGLVKNALGGGNPTARTTADADAPALPEGSNVVAFDAKGATQDAPTAQAAAEKSNPTTTRDYSVDPFVKLPAGFKAVTIMGVKLSENANNDYQGAVYNGTLKFNGKQTDAGAKY